MKKLLMATAACAIMPLAALAQDKPEKLQVGVTAFLTGPASVFGVPAKDAAEIERTLAIGAEQGVANPYVLCPEAVDLL